MQSEKPSEEEGPASDAEPHGKASRKESPEAAPMRGAARRALVQQQDVLYCTSNRASASVVWDDRREHYDMNQSLLSSMN